MLQKWLREVHDIEVWAHTIQVDSECSEYQYCIRYLKYPNEKRDCRRYEVIESFEMGIGTYYNKAHPDHDNYENCLEKGLREALNLI